MNIDYGEVSDSTPKIIGDRILEKITGKSVFDNSYARKDMAVTTKSKSSI